MTDDQKKALRATLDYAVDKTIADYHGFMEGTVHDKAKVLLNADWRSSLVENMAAAVDAATPVEPPIGDQT